MKFTKKCDSTQQTKQSIKDKLDKRCSSAGMFYTSSAGAVTSLILMLALALFGLNGSASATTSSLTISVTDSVSLSTLPTSTTGTFATSDTSTNNISVKTTNGTGYTLGIKASTEGGNTLNGANSTSIPSHTVTAGVSESNYKDDTYASTNNLNNTWGYRPSKLNSTANSNYLPGPTSASTITTLDKTSVANPTTANNYNLAIGTRVNNSTAPGTYSNTFIVTVVANPAIYSITYNKNTTDTVSNMPANVVNQETSGETVTLSNNTPTRDGYNFQGWCTTQVADGADCTGTSYAAGATWTIDQTVSSNSLSLYARWKVSKIYIQDLTLSQCQVNIGTNGNTANIGDNITVYDKRDENDYTVRYINGECWMTQNLRFQGSSIDTTNTNTNANKSITWYDLAGTEGSSTSGKCYYNWISGTGNGYSNACKHNSGNTTNGVWYNYAGVTAMTITGASNSTKANYDICPKNWHLPTGSNATSGTDINKLIGNATESWQNPTAGLIAFGAVTGGSYNGGSLGSTGEGYWWSANAPTGNAGKDWRYGIRYASSDGRFVGGFYGSRSNGIYARCVRSV